MHRFKTLIAILALSTLMACERPPETFKSSIQPLDVEVQTGVDGTTIEQDNIARRLLTDNTPGSIKHLYVISAFSGDVLLYSTVDGKVTSSGKRLSPYTVASGEYRGRAIPVRIHGMEKRTDEVLQDDGAYGGSVPYIYWWDVQGRYHQHYVVGGQIVHISDQAISVPKVVINLEQ